MRDPKALLAWLLAPATDEVPRSHAVGATVLRIVVGLMWLYNVAWKRPPDFGQDGDSGLFHFTSYAVSHPVFPPYSWVVDHLVLPLFVPFGWMVLILETALAVLLLTGSYVRLAAALGVAQSLAIGLSVAYAPNEWPWSYWLMIGAHLVLLFSSAGRMLAVDSVRAGLSSGRVLGRTWGVLALVVGLFGVIASFGDPLTGGGATLGSSDPSVSFGRYNLLGGVVVLAAGVLLLLASRGGATALGMASAALGVVAGLSLHAQIGFTDPLLGGNATSAAFLFSVAAVAVTVARAPSRRPARHTVAT